MNIFLVGPMGSGKSSLGKKLAKSLDKKFIDTDKEIEKNERKTISEIFENSGESYFREKEREFLINIPNNLNRVLKFDSLLVNCSVSLLIFFHYFCYL